MRIYDYKCLNSEHALLLHNRFLECVALIPDNPAVIDGKRSISYKELNFESNKLANYLRREWKLQKGKFAVVSYPRSIEFIIAVLAVVKAGAAYVPIDITEPPSRKEFILEEVESSVFITPEKIEGHESIDIRELKLENESADMPAIKTKNEDTVCIFYTSGSTGIPKGVELPHQALSALVRSPRYLNLHPGNRVLSGSNIAFDMGSFEIWLTLSSGAVLVCADYHTMLDPEKFGKFLVNQKIHLMWITSALFDQMAYYNPAMFRKLRFLVIGGDIVNPKSVKKLFECPEGYPHYIMNGYGPTEAGMLATACVIKKTDKETLDGNVPIPIGYGLIDTQLYVLDSELRPVKPGDTGELYIGGARIAKGYFKRPELTERSFIRNPFTGNPVDKLYKTGDLVRFRKAGALDYIGRADRQIKLNGKRIELDGIERKMLEYSGVENVAIVLHKTNYSKYLIGFVQPFDYEKFKVEDYKSFLKSIIPSYMVPSRIVKLYDMPLTPRGKLDRRKLLTLVNLDTDIIKPRNEIEDKIWNIWTKVLGDSEISVDSNFFHIGGNSILLISLVSELNRLFVKNFSAEVFLTNNTIEKQAKMLTGEVELHTSKDSLDKDLALAEQLSDLDFSQIKSENNIVLLTGVTGFLGIHLFEKLIRQTDKKIICLLRNKNASGDKASGLKNALEKYKIKLKDSFLERVKIVTGDLELPNLGINKGDYEHLKKIVNEIYHCGAYVNHLLNYEMLRKANVLCVFELIKFANESKHKVWFYFISSVSSISITDEKGRGIETFSDDYPSEEMGGYGKTKWCAEYLLNIAFRNNMNGVILRPGNIFANTVSGVTNPPETNHLLMLIESFIRYRKAPNIDLNFEFIPVDILAETIIKITQDGAVNRQVLNLSNPNEISLKGFISILEDIFAVKIKLIPYANWKAEVIDNIPEENHLAGLKLLYTNDYKEALSSFRTDTAAEALKRQNIAFPSNYYILLKDAFDKYLLKRLKL